MPIKKYLTIVLCIFCTNFTFSSSPAVAANSNNNIPGQFTCPDERYGAAGIFPRSELKKFGLSDKALNTSYWTGNPESSSETLRSCHSNDNDINNPIGCMDKRTMSPLSNEFTIRNLYINQENPKKRDRWKSLERYVKDNPGKIWRVENEPNIWQAMNGYITSNTIPMTKGLHPEQYAKIYRKYYEIIKGWDPTAKMAIGPFIPRAVNIENGCLRDNPSRCPASSGDSYMDNYFRQVVNSYRKLFGEKMPADLFMIHDYPKVRWECGQSDQYYPEWPTSEVAYRATKEGVRRQVNLITNLHDGVSTVYDGQEIVLSEWGYIHSAINAGSINVPKFIIPKSNSQCIADYVKKTVEYLEKPESGITRWVYFYGPHALVRNHSYCGHHYDTSAGDAYLNWPCWSGWLYEKDSGGKINKTIVGDMYYFMATREIKDETTGQIIRPGCYTLPGDGNKDGKVDGIDYLIWLNHYGTTTTRGSEDGDYNTPPDGKVDGIDYVIWLGNYK